MMKKIFLIILAVALVLPLVSCAKNKAEKGDNEAVCGGWSNKDEELTEEELAIFNDAMQKEVVDMQFTPKRLIGTQVVAGLNYRFLCEAGDTEYVVQIYHDLQGNNTVTDITEYNKTTG